MHTVTFTITTFNCKNLKLSLEEIQSLCNRCDVIMLQETWLLDFELPLLASIHKDFYSKGVSAIDNRKGIVLNIILCRDIETNPGLQCNKISKLNVSHCNIRGLSSSKLRASLCSQYDIITFSDTFLSSASNQDLTLHGYHPIERRDSATFGHGVALYVKEALHLKGYQNLRTTNNSK